MSRQTRIETLIEEAFHPYYYLVEDESSQHHVPEDAQTHFKLTVVSNTFNGSTPIARHRQLNSLLKEEFSLGLHALSMHLFTENEWASRNQGVLNSPSCRDGFNQD